MCTKHRARQFRQQTCLLGEVFQFTLIHGRVGLRQSPAFFFLLGSGCHGFQNDTLRHLSICPAFPHATRIAP